MNSTVGSATQLSGSAQRLSSSAQLSASAQRSVQQSVRRSAVLAAWSRRHHHRLAALFRRTERPAYADRVAGPHVEPELLGRLEHEHDGRSEVELAEWSALDARVGRVRVEPHVLPHAGTPLTAVGEQRLWRWPDRVVSRTDRQAGQLIGQTVSRADRVDSWTDRVDSWTDRKDSQTEHFGN